MSDTPHLAPRTLPRLALALATIVAAAPLAAAESAINLKPVFLRVTEPDKPDALTTVRLGQPVKIRCPVEVSGTAYQRFGDGSVWWGAPTWILQATKTQASLGFNPALKVLLTDGVLGVEEHLIHGVSLNPTSIVNAPEAPPNYISYPFDNAGKAHMIEADWAFKTEGKHTVRCEVDSGQSIKETTESDNTRGVPVLVIGSAKLHEQPAPTVQAPSRVLPPPPPDAVPADRKPRPSPGSRSATPESSAERVRLNPQPEPPSKDADRSSPLRKPAEPMEPPGS